MTTTKSRLNILHVILSRGFAGSERSTAESCNQQCRQHDVSIIVKRNHRKHDASIVDHLDSKIKVITVPSRLFTKVALESHINRLAPDIIHTHLRRSTRLLAQIKPVSAIASTLHIGINGPDFMAMDGLVCNARWQLQDIPKNFQGQAFKANNSVSPHRRLSQEEVLALRRELDQNPEQTLLIGAVGRYHPSKAWDTLITAFKRVENPVLRLLFFGLGSQEQHLKRLAEGDSRIRFVGYRKDIKDLYQAFDLVACPSRFEPLPRVILEAMDAGTPVLASDTGGCKELIEDYGGYMFRTDDVDNLAKTLKACTDEKPPRHYPDLSSHHLEKANAAMEQFYYQLITQKQGLKSLDMKSAMENQH